MAYDINKWVENDIARMPRRRHWGWAILLGMAFTLVLPAIELFDAQGGDRGNALFVLAPLPLLLAITQSPFARDSWLAERRLAMFDEFERAAITAATRRAYSVLLTILVWVFVWLWLASDNGWPMPARSGQWMALGLSLVAIAAALPIFFAEITVPFPSAGDEGEEE